MDIKNTFRVYKTLTEMLTDRGYSISKDVDYDEFIIMYEENNYDITDNDNKIHIAFYKDTKTFGKKDLESMVQNIKDSFNDQNIKIIIILKDKPNVTIEKELTNDLYQNVEIFLFKNLLINIIRHNDMPIFILLSNEEEKEIIERYKTTKNKFPKIFTNDPVVKYYGCKPGNVLKIIRSSQSSGEYITYRVVR